MAVNEMGGGPTPRPHALKGARCEEGGARGPPIPRLNILRPLILRQCPPAKPNSPPATGGITSPASLPVKVAKELRDPPKPPKPPETPVL